MGGTNTLELKMFKLSTDKLCSDNQTAFNDATKNNISNRSQIEEIYGLDLGELADTQIGRQIKLSQPGRALYLLNLAESSLLAQGDDGECSIDDLLDCQTEEALIRKKRAGQLARQFIVVMKEDERLAFIRDNNAIFGKGLKSYIEKSSHKSVEEIVKDYEIIDDFVTGYIDGLNDYQDAGIPSEIISEGASTFYTVELHNLFHKQAGSIAYQVDHESDEMQSVQKIISNKLQNMFAFTSLQSGQFSMFGDDASVRDSLKKCFDKLIPDEKSGYKPNGGKGLWNLLDDKDRIRLASVEGIYKEFDIGISFVAEGESSITSLRFDGIELFGDDTKITKENSHALFKLKNAIANAYYRKMDYSNLDDFKLFDVDPSKGGMLSYFENSFMEDMQQVIPDILKQNTTWYDSSKKYREMQKAVDEFNAKHKNSGFDELDDEESKKLLLDDLNSLTQVVKDYLYDKDGFNKDRVFHNEYERKRVDGAREIYRILVNKKRQFGAYEKRKEYNEYKKTLLNKYPENSHELVMDIYDMSFSKKKFKPAQIDKLRQNFEKLCLNKIRGVMDKLGGFGDIADETLYKEIRELPLYEGLFGSKDNPNTDIDPAFAREILENNLDTALVKSIEEKYQDMAREIKQKEEPQNVNGGKAKDKDISAENKAPQVLQGQLINNP